LFLSYAALSWIFCPPSLCSIRGWDAIGISREGREKFLLKMDGYTVVD
jgi:hypothetical protein